MHAPLPAGMAAAQDKCRTITLTHRAPIRIVESNWPVIAQGTDGYNVEGAPYNWTMELRVRQNVDQRASYIIYATYTWFDSDGWDDDINHDQSVRVGRKVVCTDTAEACAAWHLWQHILEVGEELRSRIVHERWRKHVTFVVDRCFAQLPPMEIK
jgi:hypothetical protein